MSGFFQDWREAPGVFFGFRFPYVLVFPWWGRLLVEPRLCLNFLGFFFAAFSNFFVLDLERESCASPRLDKSAFAGSTILPWRISFAEAIE